MTQIDIGFENIYEGELDVETLVDEKSILNNTEKIMDFLLKLDRIRENFCLKNFDFKSVSFDILLVSDDYIKNINAEYRNKPEPTDVITFALFADSEPKFLLDGDAALGEIIISLDTIKKQAKKNGFTFANELYYIISHGILHLLGYDHLTQEDYDFMVEVQKESLKVINV